MLASLIVGPRLVSRDRGVGSATGPATGARAVLGGLAVRCLSAGYGAGAGDAGGDLWRVAAVGDRAGARDRRVQAGRRG